MRARALCVSFIVVFSSCGGLPTASTSDPVVVSAVVNVAGVADRDEDPSTVTVTNARGEICSGVLLASDVVLTARHCVTDAATLVDCSVVDILPPAAADPATLQVSAGAPSWSVSAGAAVLTSSDVAICGADIAIVILASGLGGVVPALVSQSGIAEGGHVRTVGLVAQPTLGDGEAEVVREHVPVVAVSPTELAVGQATCVGAGGSPAYDETTGYVVGVLSRAGSGCAATAQFDVFTRTDAFYGLVQQGLEWQPTLALGPDGGVDPIVDAGKKREAGRAKKPPTDLGAACSTGAECGTGLCVTAEGSEYCSRSCAPDDHCPTDFKCVIAQGGLSVCVSS